MPASFWDRKWVRKGKVFAGITGVSLAAIFVLSEVVGSARSQNVLSMAEVFRKACIGTAPDFADAFAAAGIYYRWRQVESDYKIADIGGHGPLSLSVEEFRAEEVFSGRSCKLRIGVDYFDGDWADDLIGQIKRGIEDDIGIRLNSTQCMRGCSAREKELSVKGRKIAEIEGKRYVLNASVNVWPNYFMAKSSGAALWLGAIECTDTKCPEEK